MGEQDRNYTRQYGRGGILEQMMKTTTAPSSRTRDALRQPFATSSSVLGERRDKIDLANPFRPAGVTEWDILNMDPTDRALMFDDERVRKTTTYGKILDFAQGISTGVSDYLQPQLKDDGKSPHTRAVEELNQTVGYWRQLPGAGDRLPSIGVGDRRFEIDQADDTKTILEVVNEELASEGLAPLSIDEAAELKISGDAVRRRFMASRFGQDPDAFDFQGFVAGALTEIPADLASVIPRFVGNTFRLFSGDPAANRTEHVDLGFMEFNIHGKAKAGGIMAVDLLDIIPGVKAVSKGVKALSKGGRVADDILELPYLATVQGSATEGMKGVQLLTHDQAAKAAEAAAKGGADLGFGWRGGTKYDPLALPSPEDVRDTLRVSSLQAEIATVEKKIIAIEQARGNIRQITAAGGVPDDELLFLDDILKKIEGPAADGSTSVVARMAKLLDKRTQGKIRTGDPAHVDLDVEAEIDALLQFTDQLHALAAIGTDVPGAASKVTRAARKGSHAVQKGKRKLAMRQWEHAEDLRLKNEMKEALGLQEELMEAIASCMRGLS